MTPPETVPERPTARAANYRCQEPDCVRGFKNKVDLECHERAVHGREALQCEGCQKTFSHQANLKRHQKQRCPATAVRVERFSCQFCGSSFPRKDNWRRHEGTCKKKKNDVREPVLAPVVEQQVFYGEEDAVVQQELEAPLPPAAGYNHELPAAAFEDDEFWFGVANGVEPTPFYQDQGFQALANYQVVAGPAPLTPPTSVENQNVDFFTVEELERVGWVAQMGAQFMEAEGVQEQEQPVYPEAVVLLNVDEYAGTGYAPYQYVDPMELFLRR